MIRISEGHLTCLFLMAMISSLFGQSEEETSSHFHFGVSISSSWNYRTLTNYNGNPDLDFVVDIRNSTEVGIIGYSGGVLVTRDLSKFLELEVGIIWSLKGYKTKWKEYRTQVPDPRVPDRGRFKYFNYYLDVPLKANYWFYKSKKGLYSTLGLVSNIFIIETVESEEDFGDGNTEKEKSSARVDYAPVSLSVVVGGGWLFPLNDKNELRLEVNFEHGVTKIIDASISGWLWRAGLGAKYIFH